MPVGKLLTVVALVACIFYSPPAAAQPRVDPAERGEWLAFAEADLRPLETLQARASVAALLHAALPGVCRAIGPLSATDLDVLTKATAAAAEGKLVSIWVLPDLSDGRTTIRLAARIAPAGDQPLQDLGPPVEPGSSPLRTRYSLLSRDGFDEWPAHRSAGAGKELSGSAFLAVGFNLDAIRHAVGDEFAAGPDLARGPDLLSRLNIANARVVGLHVRLIPAAAVTTKDPSLPRRVVSQGPSYVGPPLAILRATWSSRAEAAGAVRANDLSSDYWPLSQVPLPADPDAALVMVARTTWRTLAPRVMSVYESTVPAPSRPAFLNERRDWSTESGDSLVSLLGGLATWAVLDVPIGPPLAALRLRAPLRSGTSSASARDLLERATKSLSSPLPEAASAWSHQASDRWSRAELVWAVRIEKPATVELMLKFPSP